MKRFALSLILVCALSGPALAGEVPSTGTPKPGGVPSTGSPSPGEIPTLRSPGEVPTTGISLLLTILDLAF